VELSTFNGGITVAKKIAKVDNDAMNQLFAGEISRMTGRKSAAGFSDEKGAPHDPQAFEDHSEYLATLAAVMKESADDASANDPLRD
jgi:hypothetical protein